MIIKFIYVCIYKNKLIYVIFVLVSGLQGHKVSVYCLKCVHSRSLAHLNYIDREGKAHPGHFLWPEFIFLTFPDFSRIFPVRFMSCVNYVCAKFSTVQRNAISISPNTLLRTSSFVHRKCNRAYVLKWLKKFKSVSKIYTRTYVSVKKVPCQKLHFSPRRYISFYYKQLARGTRVL